MTVSTDGQICYGILFEEEFEFPWDDERYEGEIEEWWREINEYKPPFYLYDERGEYIDGKKPTEDMIKAYFDARDVFDNEHPLSFEMVNVCSHDYPIYILALKDIGLRVNRGYPKTFDPTTLTVVDEQRNILIEFCKTHKIDTGDSKPDWYLSSFWG